MRIPKAPLRKRFFNDSYAEFLLKIQAYNPENKFSKFSDIVAADGRANSLHYKCSFAVLHHIDILKNKIPGLYDTAGRMNLSFEFPEFKVMESDINDKNLHKVAIIYSTGIFTLQNNFGEWLVLSTGDNSGHDEMQVTFTVKIQEDLSIISYQGIEMEKAII